MSTEKTPLNAQHIAEGAKEGDGKAKDGDRDGDRGVAGTLLGSSNFRADEVGDGVAAALGSNLLDHCDLLFGWGECKEWENEKEAERMPISGEAKKEKKTVGCKTHSSHV